MTLLPRADAATHPNHHAMSTSPSRPFPARPMRCFPPSQAWFLGSPFHRHGIPLRFGSPSSLRSSLSVVFHNLFASDLNLAVEPLRFSRRIKTMNDYQIGSWDYVKPMTQTPFRIRSPVSHLSSDSTGYPCGGRRIKFTALPIIDWLNQASRSVGTEPHSSDQAESGNWSENAWVRIMDRDEVEVWIHLTSP